MKAWVLVQKQNKTKETEKQTKNTEKQSIFFVTDGYVIGDR